ncbi:tripartite ATP-independent periplasmic transporter, DctQ component (plasmid) [Pseudosulfitobacter pseudonitzschiae]|uniref:TRAP transporter small permease protein n=1 Tax=Pseudosulfitobacter pseudonitzschiae TaxID=1402135 RepID=A0A221K9E0_9RHOB|nr:TRAP transporter small permease [Pseudosulfitobacter pseudonitzschiae]ASM75622.1 tripartite ATP-independent periplasmic transporter, DctQ component [Pseudosulfitobacter pseudonitzschiae]
MHKAIKALSHTANWLAVLALVAMFAHIVLEIVLRNFFDTSTFVLDEFVGYAVSALTFLALGEAFRSGALIQVTLVRDLLGARGKYFLDVFGHLAAFSMGILIAWYVGRSVLRNYERGTTSSSIAEVPQWIPELFVLLGVIIFALRVVESLIGLSQSGAHGETEV